MRLDVVALALFAALIGLSFAVPALVLFRHTVHFYLKQIWWAVLLGFFLGGILERFVPREYISAILAQKRKRTILASVFLGLAMSACSHGILALSMELHRKGASVPVVVSFLLASPWANLPITLMLLSFFGWKAWYIILGALLVAFNTGLVFQWLEKKGWVEPNPHTLTLDTGYSIREDVLKRLRQHHFSWGGLTKDLREVGRGAWMLADMVGGWILLGLVLSGLAASFVPQDFFKQYMGPTVPGLLATLVLAIVMEVCSEGTAPMAFELFRQTGAFGNAFVFLMAGVVTDITEIGVVWANVGRRAALWIPLVSVPQVVALGLLANLF